MMKISKMPPAGFLALIMLTVLSLTFTPAPALADLTNKLKAATKQLEDYTAKMNAQAQSQHNHIGAAHSGGGSLSSALGATNLDGLSKFANCMDPITGYHERLTADLLAVKLANMPMISAEERSAWLEDIMALRNVRAGVPYKPADPADPQRYLLRITDDEQVQINSKNTTFVQQVHLQCEHQYGGMSRYSGTGDMTLQNQYEAELAVQYQTNTSAATAPVKHVPSRSERSAVPHVASAEAQQTAVAQCADSVKGLRARMIAQALQQKLLLSPNLAGKNRQEFEADVQAAWMASSKGLDWVQSPDPKFPNRPEQRLNQNESMAMNTEYMKQYTQIMQGCIGSAGTAGRV